MKISDIEDLFSHFRKEIDNHFGMVLKDISSVNIYYSSEESRQIILIASADFCVKFEYAGEQLVKKSLYNLGEKNNEY